MQTDPGEGARGARPVPDVRGLADNLGVMRWSLHADANGIDGRHHLPDTAAALREVLAGLAVVATEAAAIGELLLAHRHELVDDVDELTAAVAELGAAARSLRPGVG